ncbi:NAD-P-binding protein [Daedaleopsis nitida]|nr:NAD-P-binding protein [Daedaleopsis nitida]
MAARTRIAIVTGAAQGIGEAIALQLASDGLDVAINDIPTKHDQLAAVAKAIEQKGRRAAIVTGDVSLEADVISMVKKTVDELGGLDIFVANAGILLPLKPMVECTVEDWDRALSINGRGVFLGIKHAALRMIEQGRGGRIICASSDGGKFGIANDGIYCASKFAVRGLVQSAALELRKHKITVNAYCPGFILTPMTMHPDDEKYGGPGMAAKTICNFPEDIETGQPSDIAGIVSYLAKPESSFVTGQSYSVNGGLYLS